MKKPNRSRANSAAKTGSAPRKPPAKKTAEKAAATAARHSSPARDAAGRSATEQALRESEERYRSLVELSPDAIAVHAEGKYVYINPAGAKIFGGSDPCEIIGKPVLDLVHPGFRDFVRERMLQSYEQGRPAPLRESKLLRLDGTAMDVEVATTPIAYAGKSSTLMILRDIAGKKKAQEELQKSWNTAVRERRRLEAILDTVPAGLIVYDSASSKIILQNQQVLHIMGRTLDAANQELRIQEFKMAKPDGSPFVLGELPGMRAIQTGGIVRNVEMLVTRADGSRITVLSNAAPLRNEAETVIGAVISLNDITPRKQLEEEFGTILRTAMDGFLIVDDRGRILEVNGAYCTMSGYSRDELLRMRIQDLEALENPEDTARHIETVQTTGYDRFETRHTRKDGGIFDVEVSVNSLRDGSGRMHGFFHDITKRKQAEETLNKAYAALETRVQERTRELQEAHETVKAERQRFYGVLEMLPAYVVLLSPDHHVSFANRFFRERFGESRGRACYEFLFERTEPCENCETFKVLGTKAPHHWEWNGPDGRNYDIFDYPFTDSDGSPLILEMGIDITERKQAETALKELNETLEQRVAERTESLRESRENMARAQAVGQIGSWHLDVNRNVLTWSEENHRIFGLPMGTPMNYETFLGTIHPDDRDYVDRKWRAALNGEPYDIEHRIIAEGTVKWVREKAYLEFDKDGGLLGGFGITQDITERKQAEEALQQAHAEMMRRSCDLEAVNRELEDFSYAVSHDLRAPLRTIEGFTAAIIEDYGASLPETAKDYFNRVISASRRMSQLIDAMLNMARLTKGEIREKTVDLSGLAEIAAHELRKRDPGRVVDFAIAKELKAQGDRDMLNTVLENLLDNAWKFTARRSSARIEFGSLDKNGGKVFFVKDDGAGFDTRFAAKLFMPFKRFHSDSEFPGLGIGLTIVHRIILRHNGRIWAESEPEKGATFFFTL